MDELNAIKISLNEQLYEAKQNNNSSEEIEILKKLIELNDVEAMYALGIIYIVGEKVVRDTDNAYKYFLLAAQKEHPHAQFSVGLMHYQGDGVEQSGEIALSWFLKAQEHSARAKYNLGIMYYYGEGVEVDYQEAYKYFSEASIYNSRYFLALMNYYGLGREQNLEEAAKLFEYCSAQEDGLHNYYLGLMYYYGQFYEQDYKKAAFHFGKNPEHEESNYYLGLMYYYGDYYKQDYKKAAHYFRKNPNHAQSNFKLGLMYYYGIYYAVNYKKAYKHFLKAAKQKHNEAQYQIGLLYFYGQAVKQSYKVAYEWFEEAALEGRLIKAYNSVSIMLNEGLGVKQDKEKAKEYLALIKKNGFKHPLTNLIVRDFDQTFKFEYHKKFDVKNQTDTYYLRDFVFEDYERLFEIYNNKDFRKLVPHTINSLASAQGLARHSLKQAQLVNMNVFAICDKNTDQMIGKIDFYIQDNLFTFGYVLDHKYWDKKIGTSAAYEALNILFAKTQYEFIYANVAKENIGSIKILLKLNFKYNGEIIDYLSAGKKIESYQFKLTKEDFLSLR